MPDRALCRQRPCFCEICIGCSLYDLLDERARLLRDALDDHAYSPEFERDLADELIAGIPAARRAAALEIMVTDHLSPRVMNVDCLLNECDERSYAAVSQMAATLLAAIWEQGTGPSSLRILVTNEIVHRERLMSTETCGTCNNKGVIVCPEPDGTGAYETACPDCDNRAPSPDVTLTAEAPF